MVREYDWRNMEVNTMNKKISKMFFPIILFIIIVFTFVTNSNAMADIFNDGAGGQSGTSTEYPNLNIYRPSIPETPIAKGMLENILGVLQVIGVIATVVVISIIGFKTILGSASEKAFEKNKFIGILIAVIMITSGITIAKFIISAVE